MINLFITGEVQIGKSTMLKNILERVNLSMGGYITDRDINGDTLIFTVQSLFDGVTRYPIAMVDTRTRDRKILYNSFKNGITSILNESLKSRDLIVLDELGFMENNIDEFTSTVYRILDSDKIVLGVLKKHRCDFINNIKSRKDTIIVEMTLDNRDKLLNRILSLLKSKGLTLKKDSLVWNPDKVHWYDKALNHPSCTYPKGFIEEIKKYTGDLINKSILDIGSGSGAFAIPLARRGANITAVDSSFNMTYSLIDKARLNNLNNIKCIISPFDQVDIPKHDFAISAFSGGGTRTHRTISKMNKSVNKYSFIISSFENQKSNLKMDILYKMLGWPSYREYRQKKTISHTLRMLDNLNCRYIYKPMDYELSQYFNGFNEAVDFFIQRLKIVKDKEIEITKKFLTRYLVTENDEYKLENINRAYLIAIKPG